MKIETKFDLGQMVWVFHDEETKSLLCRKEIKQISMDPDIPEPLGDGEIFITYSFREGCASYFHRHESDIWSSAEEAGEHIAKEAIEKMKIEDES